MADAAHCILLVPHFFLITQLPAAGYLGTPKGLLLAQRVTLPPLPPLQARLVAPPVCSQSCC